MSPTRPTPGQRSGTALLAVLALVATLFGISVPATQAASSYPLSVDLTGVFRDGDATRTPSRSIAVGTVASGWKTSSAVASPRYGFSFAAPCETDASLRGASTTCENLKASGKLYWHWDFGDGRTQTTTADNPGADIVYTKPGAYTVSVIVDNLPTGGTRDKLADTYQGRGELKVLVSPRFADADSSDGTKTSPTDAEAIWTAAALGLMDDCGTYFPAAGGLLSGEQAGDPGRQLFCPQAPAMGSPTDVVDSGLLDTVFTEDGASTAPWTTFANSMTNVTPARAAGAHNGDVLRFRDPSVGDRNRPYLGLQSKAFIPYAPTSLYKLTARMRVASNPSDDVTRRVYMGVAGYTAAGAYANTSGANTISNQHYPSGSSYQSLRESDGWVTFTGYISGSAPTGGGGGATRTAPMKLHSSVTQFKPILLVNYPVAATPGQGDGTTEIDYYKVEKISVAGTSASTTSLTYSKNGIFTTQSCLTSPQACGLPASSWANNNPGSSVNTPCGTACQRDLREQGLFSDATGLATYDPTSCSDNWTLRRGSSTLTPGVEDGCVSYGDFATALATALDGGKTAGVEVAADCSTSPASTGVRRAALLLSGTAAATANPGLVRVCDENASLSKAEAYGLVAAAIGSSGSANAASVNRLRDLSTDRYLTYGPIPAANLAALVAGVLEQGAPLVGNLTCPDRFTRMGAESAAGTCFGGGAAMMRREAAQLLAWMALGADASVSRLSTSATPRVIRADAGQATAVRISAYVPRWYPADTTVTFAFTTPSSISVSCPTTTVTVGSDRTAAMACTVTGSQATGSSGEVIGIRTSDSLGGRDDTAAFTAIIRNDAPTPGALQVVEGALTEGSSAKLRLLYDDPQGDAVTVGVRSCLPVRDGSCVSSGATFPRNGSKARTTTSDTDPATFTEVAETDIGSVTLNAVSTTGIALSVNPADPDNHGAFDFVVVICDTAGACAQKYVRLTSTAVNDRPAPFGLVSVTDVDPTGKTVTLGGTDARDVAQPGYPDPNDPIEAYRVCSLPATLGANWVKDDGTTGPAVVVGASSTYRRLKVYPSDGTPAGTYTLTYQVMDRGQGPTIADKAWSGDTCTSGATGTVKVTTTAVGQRTVTITTSPTTGAAYSEEITVAVNGSGPSARTTVNWGDGTSTGPVSTSTLKHRYSQAGTYTVATTVTVDGVTTSRSQVVSIQANHLAEPTFESGGAVADWTPTSAATLLQTTTIAHGGERGLQALSVSSGQCGVTTPVSGTYRRTKAGETYQARVWLYRPNATPMSVTLAELNGSSASTNVAAPSAGGWTQAVLTVTSTKNNSSLNLRVTSTGAGTNDTCFVLDDASVTGTVLPISTAYRAAVMADKPWGYWPLDEPAGSPTAFDASGNRRHLEVSGRNGDNGLGQPGITPGGGSTGSYLSDGGALNGIATGLAPSAGNAITIEMWTDISNLGATRTTNSYLNNFCFVPEGSGCYNTFLPTNSNIMSMYLAPGFIGKELGTGKQLITMVVANDRPNTEKLYVNGVLVAASTSSTGAGALKMFDRFVLGNNAPAGDSPWPWPIDDIAMYQGELSAAAISRHYAAATNAGFAAYAAAAPVTFFSATMAGLAGVDDLSTAAADELAEQADAARAEYSDALSPAARRGVEPVVVEDSSRVDDAVVGPALGTVPASRLDSFAVAATLPAGTDLDASRDLWRVRQARAVLVEGTVRVRTADGALWQAPIGRVDESLPVGVTVNIDRDERPEVFVNGAPVAVDQVADAPPSDELTDAEKRRAEKAAAAPVAWAEATRVDDDLLDSGGRVYVYDATLSAETAQSQYTGLVYRKVQAAAAKTR